MGALETIALGAIGAIVPDLLKFINGRFDDPPPWVKRLHYWIGAAALVALGGTVAYYSHPAREIDALALGYAAPAIVASLLGRKDGGKKELTTDVNVGLSLDDISHPERRPSLQIPIPTFVRGIRSAWAMR